MEIKEKSELRKWIKERRNQITTHEMAVWNQRILKQLLSLPVIIQSEYVYCYVSFGREAGTKELILTLLRQGKKVAVPRINKKDMDFYQIYGFDHLVSGSMGILEPDETCEKIEVLAAPVIVPGLAFDKDGGRIGYGGGFYDRFFQKEPNHIRIGIAYPFQLYHRVPEDAHDVKMNLVIGGE